MRPLFYKRGATFSRLLEYAGAALGLLGAALLASHTAFSPLGWFSFAASNLLLIGFAVVHRHRGLLVLHAVSGVLLQRFTDAGATPFGPIERELRALFSAHLSLECP